MSTSRRVCSLLVKPWNLSCRMAISARSPDGSPVWTSDRQRHREEPRMSGNCRWCGAPGSPSGSPAACAACQVPARLPAVGAAVAAASWLAVAGRGKPRADLAALLRSYRHASGMTQQQLADMLGFDRTYISMIECGRRGVTDRGTLAHIASTLAVPPHVLGIAGYDDADFASMLAFGTSVIRLADIARHCGRAADAVSELWPLITRLEARTSAGHAEAETMRLLAQARLSLGVALGHLLPEERLATAARWTGRALRIAWSLGDAELLAFVLRMHGNELRKAGYAAAGIVRLRQSLQIDDQPARKGGSPPLTCWPEPETSAPQPISSPRLLATPRHSACRTRFSGSSA